MNIPYFPPHKTLFPPHKVLLLNTGRNCRLLNPQKCPANLQVRLNTFSVLFFSWRNSPRWAKAASLSRPHNHTHAHHTRQDSSGRGTSPSQRPLPDNTQHSQNRHPCPRNPSKRAAAATRRRPRGHWDLL